MEPLICVSDLSYVYMTGTPYEAKALNGIDLQIFPGEMIGIVGPTGCGKSTLVQHFNGILRPTSGSVIVDGLDLSNRKLDLKLLRRRVGLVFQYPEYQLFEETVAADVAFGPTQLGFEKEKIEVSVRDAIRFMGLDFDTFKNRSPFSLSGGEMRRVAIAGVLAMEPSVLILDEPTAGLDPTGRKNLLDKLCRLNRERGVTVIIVSHAMDEIVEIAHKIVVMAEGTIVSFGPVNEVFRNTQTISREMLPQCTQVLRALHESGLDVDTDCFTIDDTVKTICRRFGK